jgi:hypothetical protein
MKTIYKYALQLVDEQEVELPKWCTPLSAQMQNNEIQMWALVDKSQPLVKATVKIFGTGEAIPDNFYVGREHHTYLGTAQHGSFVWHVFITGSFTSQS